MDENQKFGIGGAQQYGREQYGPSIAEQHRRRVAAAQEALERRLMDERKGAENAQQHQPKREMGLEELIRQLLPGHRARCEYQTLRLWQQENEQRKILLEEAQKELSTQIEDNRLLESRLADARRQVAILEVRCVSLESDKRTLSAAITHWTDTLAEERRTINALRRQIEEERWKASEDRMRQAAQTTSSGPQPQRPFFGPTIPPPGESAKPITGGGLAPGNIGLGQPTTLADLEQPFTRVFGRSVPQPTTIIPGQPGQKLRITDVERLGAAAEVARDPLAGTDDTPLLAARRKAFDSPTIANLDALIQAARDPYETVPGVQTYGALLNEIEDFRQITRELNMELNPGTDSCPLPHTRALKISLTELWHRYYAARDEVKRIREALKQL